MSPSQLSRFREADSYRESHRKQHLSTALRLPASATPNPHQPEWRFSSYRLDLE
jgi:hypothetical protein